MTKQLSAPNKDLKRHYNKVMTRGEFAAGEWYHCYSRGIDKRQTFLDRTDYERFIGYLYLCNSSHAVHLSNMRHTSLKTILTIPRDNILVSLGAFCLMPNHFHLIIKERSGAGISRFMQKLGTAYTMYFNSKEQRVGGLFTKPFRSRHLDNDIYFQYALQYVHCNPAELFEPGWKEGAVRDEARLERLLVEYPYGSFGAFQNTEHHFRSILGNDVFEIQSQSKPNKMLLEARMYYAEHIKATP